jgi:hypothetical protein
MVRAFKKLVLSAVISMAAIATQVHSQSCGSLYSASVTTAGNTNQFCLSSLKGLYEVAFRDFANSFPNYTGSELVNATASFNGVPATLSYAAGSPVLQVNIPSIGVSQSFSGATREASARLLHDWLKNQQDIRSSLFREQARSVAANSYSAPGGILSQTVASDFDSSLSDASFRSSSSQSNANAANTSLLGAGVLLSHHNVGGLSINSAAIPLSYTVRNDIDPRRQALIRGGIGMVDRAGSRSYNTRLSGGYRIPLSDEWALTSSLGFAFAGSDDAAYSVGLLRGSIMSTYLIEAKGFDITIGNMLGYYRTIKPPVGSFAVDPNLSNGAFRNGALISQPVTISGKKLSIEYGISDTRYFGSAIYQRSIQEISIALGTNRSAFSSRSFFRSNLAYQHSKDSNGVLLTVNYWF